MLPLPFLGFELPRSHVSLDSTPVLEVGDVMGMTCVDRVTLAIEPNVSSASGVGFDGSIAFNLLRSP